MQPCCCVAAATIAAALLKHPTSRSPSSNQIKYQNPKHNFRSDILTSLDLANCVAAALEAPFSSDEHAQAMLSLLAGPPPTPANVVFAFFELQT
jgi:hypothetical protein